MHELVTLKVTKLAEKLEQILDRRGVTIEKEAEAESTSVPSVRKKARTRHKDVPARPSQNEKESLGRKPAGKGG